MGPRVLCIQSGRILSTLVTKMGRILLKNASLRWFSEYYSSHAGSRAERWSASCELKDSEWLSSSKDADIGLAAVFGFAVPFIGEVPEDIDEAETWGNLNR